MRERQTLVSVDLDGIECYHRIHGLEPPGDATRPLVLRRCLPRFLELFEAERVRATFFVIGRDLEDEVNTGGEGEEWLRAALSAGHELGNHSHRHAYDLVRWDAAAQRDDLRRCDEVLRSIGADVVGFRAPGYTHDARMLRAIADLGYRYDSSCLPSPPYYAAKLAVMAWMRVRGRRSASLVGGWSSFFGASRPRWLKDPPVWEMPMSVTPWTRVPLIGTSLLSGPAWLSRSLSRAASGLSHFHLELHGLDLADPDEDGLDPALGRRQPELRRPLELRRDRLRSLLRLRGGGMPVRDGIPADVPDGAMRRPV